jgi:hypothetical protein
MGQDVDRIIVFSVRIAVEAARREALVQIGACRPEAHVDTIAEREGPEALALIRGY